MFNTLRRLQLRYAVFALSLLVVVGLVPAALTQGQNPAPAKSRIDPAGINGALILSGQDIPRAALERFVALAGGKDKKARVVVIHQLSAGKPLPGEPAPDKFFMSEPLKEQLAGLTIVTLTHTDRISKAEHLDALKEATGIWLTASDVIAVSKPPEPALIKSCASVLKNGGVVAGSWFAAAQLAELMTNPISGNALASGLGLLPGSLVGLASAKPGDNPSVAKMVNLHAGRVGYEIENDAALLVLGRKLFSLGEGKVTIHQAKCAFKPAKQIALQGKKGIADLTAQRNEALARTLPAFPPKKLDPPVVAKGTLVIVGGGGFPKGLIQQFVDLAGGDKAVIVVLPTAQQDPLPAKNPMTEAFKKAGAQKVTYLKARKLHEVETQETLDILREATGLWFDGGRQWGFVDAYAGTKALPLMHDVLARGGVIGGTSAGASIQGEYMPRGDPLGNLNIIADGYEKGLSFLKGVGIDQHFTQRKRHADMTQLMKTYPQLLGIGLDEATAIIVKGHVAEVTGTGKAHFYDTQRVLAEGEADFEALSGGGKYDLKARKILDKGKAHP